MHLTRRVRLQLIFFAVVTVVAGGIMAVTYLRLPNSLAGVGQYQVTVNLAATGGLYKNANVTYRGVEVGRVDDVRLSATGVDAVLTLQSRVSIPADVEAQVHSQTAIGEQYLELTPRNGTGPMLKDGDVIAVDQTSLPTDINTILSLTNKGLQAIPHDDLRTVIDEGYTAVGGLGPELRRIVAGTTKLMADANKNLDSLTTVIDDSKPVLDTQINTSDAIESWAANVATITTELRNEDPALNGLLTKGPAALDETRQLLDRLQPTLPIILANLVSLGQVALTYQPNIEQLLVLLPPAVEQLQGASLANRFSGHQGVYLSFNLNVNLPPPCSTGFYPAQQKRSPSAVDYPDRVAGNIYCRVAQDSDLDVRGVRNIPCAAHPGKRAPTAEMCESDEQYVPLNDGYNWKGDPNATLSGQPVPQLPPGVPPPVAPPPIAAATYDPATGTYTGPDGQQYTEANLAEGAPEHRDWRDMLLPPKGP